MKLWNSCLDSVMALRKSNIPSEETPLASGAPRGNWRSSAALAGTQNGADDARFNPATLRPSCLRKARRFAVIFSLDAAQYPLSQKLQFKRRGLRGRIYKTFCFANFFEHINVSIFKKLPGLIMFAFEQSPGLLVRLIQPLALRCGIRVEND
jgi:hypothetical protein